MDENMKKFQNKLKEVELEAEHLLLARHQLVENDKLRNGNREALTALRRRAKTTKTSIPSPFESIMKGVAGTGSRPLVQEVCTTCGKHDSFEQTWMMFPGTDLYARIPFHAAHVILETDQAQLDFEAKKLQSTVKEKSYLISETGALADKISPGILKSIVTLNDQSNVVGMVEEGRNHFDSMRNLYGIEPQLEHYGLMVDLYGRAGHLEEALSFINSMPLKPHAGAWSALLHACRMYKNKEIDEFASQKIVELEANNDGAYVLLSKVYADHKNWEGVRNLRQKMKTAGVKKLPGCSVIIEVDGEMHEFIVGDKSHPRYDEIELKIEEISRCVRLAGYVAHTSNVLFDIEEEEKENALVRHSEKVAIVFGLISLKEGWLLQFLNMNNTGVWAMNNTGVHTLRLDMFVWATLSQHISMVFHNDGKKHFENHVGVVRLKKQKQFQLGILYGSLWYGLFGLAGTI
ncbi:hypothetical protein RIF29_37840 [Crotalaria pallida]|uniref:DYW domain-containing protein n=1 Tax=Crotalaria pallida TaxID=3830 RepID=A0AAN9E020_CROPI